MQAVAHGWKPDRMKGPSRSVAKEFVAADEKKMALGGLLSVMQNPEERGELRRRGGAGMRPIIPQLDKGGNEAMMREGIDLAPGYQMGGLAQFRGRGPQQLQRGRGRRGPDPRMMAMMRRRQMQQAGGRRGAPPGGAARRGRMPFRPPGGGRVQPGGPGGQMPGRQMLSPPSNPTRAMSPTQGSQPGPSPGDARMPGGRAMPYRGMMQKMRGMQRGQPQGNRIGTGDQQGGLARAMQTQTGRPPISRRMAFPGTR